MKALVYKIAEGHTIDDLTEEACPGLSLDRCAGASPSTSCANQAKRPRSRTTIISCNILVIVMSEVLNTLSARHVHIAELGNIL